MFRHARALAAALFALLTAVLAASAAPAQDLRDAYRKADEQQRDDKPVEPGRQSDRLFQRGCHLDQNPTDDNIDTGDPDDIPAFQFCEKAHD